MPLPGGSNLEGYPPIHWLGCCFGPPYTVLLFLACAQAWGMGYPVLPYICTYNCHAKCCLIIYHMLSSVFMGYM